MSWCLCPDFELRGQVYEIWSDSSTSGRSLVDPRKNEVVDTDHAFDPLTNDELLAIYDYGKGW
jgi:hypothetical protein